MLGVLGYVVPEFYRFPFDIAPGLPCSEVPNGVAAIEAIPALGWMQIFFAIGATDYYGFLGDFDFGKLNLDPEVAETRKLNELQSKFRSTGVTESVVRPFTPPDTLTNRIIHRRSPCHACLLGAPPS